MAYFLLLLSFPSHHSEGQGLCLTLHPHGPPEVMLVLGPATSQVSVSALGSGALSPPCAAKKEKTHPR